MKTAEIQGYHFGRMTVNGKVHTNDLIVLPGRVLENWRRREGHRLDVGDIQVILDERPEVLVVGTGAYGAMMVLSETRQALEEAGIQLQVEHTGEAWRQYNALRGKHRTAAAFHLTC